MLIRAKCDANFGTTTSSAGFDYLCTNTFCDFIVTFFGNDSNTIGELPPTDLINVSILLLLLLLLSL